MFRNHYQQDFMPQKWTKISLEIVKKEIIERLLNIRLALNK